MEGGCELENGIVGCCILRTSKIYSEKSLPLKFGVRWIGLISHFFLLL